MLPCGEAQYVREGRAGYDWGVSLHAQDGGDKRRFSSRWRGRVTQRKNADSVMGAQGPNRRDARVALCVGCYHKRRSARADVERGERERAEDSARSATETVAETQEDLREANKRLEKSLDEQERELLCKRCEGILEWLEHWHPARPPPYYWPVAISLAS